ncbi:hypothetical protein [Shewanella decolorationis]|nr:hypothetical protein [Shewanella decolorationis]GLR34331.1 hypothetical protein GCM10007922_38900 [Shewanella decolorationis]
MAIFFARENENSNCARFSSRLAMILSDMNKFCVDDRKEMFESLSYDYQITTNHTEKNFLLYKIGLIKLSANKIDYKNWVELAVSFDQ